MFKGYGGSDYYGGRNNSLAKFENDVNSDLFYVKNLKLHPKNFIKALVILEKLLKQKPLDMRKVYSIVDYLEKARRQNKSEYFINLVYPEFAINAKIPVEMPIPTTSFRIHDQFPITTNSLGNFSLIFNPFYLESGATQTNSTLFLNNNASLNGSSSSNFYYAGGSSTAAGNLLGQLVPLNVYQKFRLVSASLHVRYLYRLDSASGVFGAGIGFQDIPAVALGTPAAALARYGFFNLMDDLQYTSVKSVHEGVRLTYVPYDPSVEEFNSMGVYKPGTSFYVYGQFLPASVQCIRADVYLNFEATVDPEFANYIPSATIDTGDSIKEAMERVKSERGLVGSLTDFAKLAAEDRRNNNNDSYYAESEAYIPGLDSLTNSSMNSSMMSKEEDVG